MIQLNTVGLYMIRIMFVRVPVTLEQLASWEVACMLGCGVCVDQCRLYNWSSSCSQSQSSGVRVRVTERSWPWVYTWLRLYHWQGDLSLIERKGDTDLCASMLEFNADALTDWSGQSC